MVCEMCELVIPNSGTLNAPDSVETNLYSAYGRMFDLVGSISITSACLSLAALAPNTCPTAHSSQSKIWGQMPQTDQSYRANGQNRIRTKSHAAIIAWLMK
jgi:hypothetical protein